MSQLFRTPAGGRIQRDQPIAFRFDGRNYMGYAGDTLASALLANDVHLVGRSFKYHRPRGILSAGSEEPNALVTVDRGNGRVTPNLRATQVELYDGLNARSQNRWPSLAFDAGSVAGLASPLLSAGFYYKTFMWPPSFWRHVYEPVIRAAAGLGRTPAAPDPDRYLHQYAHCDVLVIGAGPAGIAAALAASAAGAQVMLCDEQAELGGSLLAEPDATIDAMPAPDWLAAALGALAESVTLLPRTTAFGWYPDNLIGLAERVTDHLEDPGTTLPRERLWQVRAKQVVIATGAIERPLVFPQNDRPGVMLAGAARTYLHRYGVRIGSNVVVATTDDSAYRTALDLRAAGIGVAAIVDQRETAGGDVLTAVRNAGIPVHLGTAVTGTEGRLRVHTAKLTGATAVVPCDTLLMCGGWTPTVHLFSQSRGKLVFDAATGVFLPGTSPVGPHCAGACAGVTGLEACLESGHVVGESAARITKTVPPPLAGLVPATTPAPSLSSALIRPAKAFVDFQNDVTVQDLIDATGEGFRSIEHVKRYTTSGMATDQGKTSGLNALAVVADALGQPMPAVGLTTYRPPYTPVTFGTFAGIARGDLFDPVRRAPMHAWAAAQGAVFEDVGTWKRAQYFPRPRESMHAAVRRECRAVRGDLGILDASTLGKIEVVGPDAAAFLDRIYTARISTLAPGQCRYTLMLGEDGCVRDDGIVARLAPDRFHVTTTTGGAAGVLHHMEDYLQTEFTDLRAWLTSTTEHWAVIAVQGPRAEEIVAPLLADIDLATMPHMSVRQGSVCGIPARLFRVSFTGEPGFEINVPSAQAQPVWDALIAAGATPYGTDAMHVLRAEKGFIIVGQETDGTVTPGDLGMDWIVARAKPDFVGKRSLARSDMLRHDRMQLVGLLTADPRVVLEEGAQVVAAATAGAVSIGHVTSSYWSEALGRSIALALVAGGRARVGTTLHVPAGKHVIDVAVTKPVFLDGTKAAPLRATAPAVVPPRPVAATEAVASSPACAAVRLTALAATQRLAIRAVPAAATALGAALGVLLGTVPCRAITARDRAALWLGPDEWLVFAPDDEAGLVEQAMAAVGGLTASVVDVSHRTVSIELAGPRAVWCLNAFCALDLDQHVFPIGFCTRTLLGKAEIVLWRTESDAFHIEVARSFAPYVRGCLEEARREFLDPDPGC